MTLALSGAHQLGGLLQQRAQEAGELRIRLDVVAELRQALLSVQAAAQAIDPADLREGVQPATLHRPVDDLLRQLDGEAERLRRAVARFGKGRVNLGVLGQTGSGKSRFLRSLTGLGQREIPDQDLGATTGVPSIIRYGETFEAVVHFLTRREFLARLAPYFERLQLPAPATVEQFAAGPPPPEPPDAQQVEVHRHLLRLHEAAHTALSLLDQPPRRIATEQVADYVTQETADGEPRANYVAVERVELTARYPHGLPEVGVVDLPGLGDTNLTDAPLVLASVRDDIDVVIMMHKPSADRAIWGVRGEELKQLARQALPGIGLERRALLLLNEDRRRGSENRRQCEAVASKASVELASVSIVDAADPKAVQRFFGQAMSGLEAMVRATDAAYLDELNRQWGVAAQSVQDYLNSLSSIVAEGSGITEAWRLQRTNEARRRLDRALRRHADEVANRDESLDDIAAAYRDVVARAALVSEDVDEARFDDIYHDMHGSKALAYGAALDEQRGRMTSTLAQLDAAFSRRLDALRDELIAVMIGEGQMENLVRGTGDEAWHALQRHLQDQRTDLPADSPLIAGISDLLAARLDYAAMLQRRISEMLRLLSSNVPLYRADSLTPGAAAESDRPGSAPRPQDAPDLWDTNLVPHAKYVELIKLVGSYVLYEAVERTPSGQVVGDGGIEGVLHRSLREPEHAVAAILQSFVTTVLDSPAAAMHWQTLYSTWAGQIWVREFQEAAGRSEGLGTLLDAHRRANDLLNALSERRAPGA